jgi:hypothetical protein
VGDTLGGNLYFVPLYQNASFVNKSDAQTWNIKDGRGISSGYLSVSSSSLVFYLCYMLIIKFQNNLFIITWFVVQRKNKNIIWFVFSLMEIEKT